MLAQASRKAIEEIRESLKEQELPMVYLLGEKYIEALKSLGESDNAKIVLVPADVPSAVRGIIGSLKR